MENDLSFAGTAPGTVLTTITANDVDSSPALTYRFSNVSHPGPFSIDRFGGRVVLTDELDAEIRAEYTLHVVASDGLHEATTELTVRVTDLNDNPPRFDQVAYITTLSGTCLLLTFTTEKLGNHPAFFISISLLPKSTSDV